MAIDPHVHLRDWKQGNKETLEKAFCLADRTGLDAVFEMPNTDPAMTSVQLLKRRIYEADEIISRKGYKLFHGIYAGITPNVEQIEEMIEAYSELLPRIVGLKMFAGQSTGNMGIIDETAQLDVYLTLAKNDFRGVLAVHCEKESEMNKGLWNPAEPFTHTLARPPESETRSVISQIKLASYAGFKGTLHIAHISVPASLEYIEQWRPKLKFNVTTGITPHHALLYDQMMKGEEGMLLKMNPPLRSKWMQEYMLEALLDGRITWVETDHAPHTLKDKIEGDNEKGYASGIPGMQFYPNFLHILKNNMPERLFNDVTHNNIARTFGINIENSGRAMISPDPLGHHYEFDAFGSVISGRNNIEYIAESIKQGR